MYADRKNVLVNTVRQRKLDDRAFASIFKKCQDLSFVLPCFDIVDIAILERLQAWTKIDL